MNRNVEAEPRGAREPMLIVNGKAIVGPDLAGLRPVRQSPGPVAGIEWPTCETAWRLPVYGSGRVAGVRSTVRGGLQDRTHTTEGGSHAPALVVEE